MKLQNHVVKNRWIISNILQKFVLVFWVSLGSILFLLIYFLLSVVKCTYQLKSQVFFFGRYQVPKIPMFFPRAYHQKIQTPENSCGLGGQEPHSIVIPLLSRKMEKHVVFARGCWIMGRRGQSNGEVAVMICYRSLVHGCDGCYNHPQMAGLYRFIFYGIEFPTWPLPSFLSSPWRLSPCDNATNPPAGRSQSAAEQIVCWRSRKGR